MLGLPNHVLLYVLLRKEGLTTERSGVEDCDNVKLGVPSDV